MIGGVVCFQSVSFVDNTIDLGAAEKKTILIVARL